MIREGCGVLIKNIFHMTEQQRRNYDPEAAAELYEALHDAAAQMSDIRRAYRMLKQVFLNILDQKTPTAGIRFGGAFAKTDYLLKEYKAPKVLRATLNDARVRFRRLHEHGEGTTDFLLSDEILREKFRYDLKAVCRFTELLFYVPVPGKLVMLFPQGYATRRGELKAECLRVIVNRWDDQFLYADADEEGIEEVKVFYGGCSENSVYKEWDWGYLRDIVSEGSQLNLVRPREKDGILYPELLVFEPDYLVDISAIAACFENYSVSAVNHLLNKLKPAQQTLHTLLGNLAGQFLDESLYLYPDDCSYKESVERFFAENALSLLAAGVGQEFHEEAQRQKEHIRHMIRETLPEVFRNDNIREFSSEEIMVEPSFFSEMLGIQGRMDFLQLDEKILIEQKSGKAGYPVQDPLKPQEKHYVQLLLYMLLLRYNNHQQYEKNARNVHCLLMYSKYENGLVELGFAPELVFAAIKVRNELVAKEYGYTYGGMDILTTLTADSLNSNGVGGGLWECYQRPQIEELLKPIHTASELERAYYLRFLRFIATEHLMAKVGSQTKENGGFADKWHSTLEEKLLTGNIYCDLRLVSPAADDEGRVERVVLAMSDSRLGEVSNFRAGDIVILYPYEDGNEPDARRTMVFRATIEELSEDRITLNLRSSQVGCNVFWHNGERMWAVEHDFFDSSFSSLYRGMHAFLSAPRERRELLLLQREPQCDKTRTLKGDYGVFNELMLRTRQAQDLFLIIGPPGTGKTSFGLMNTLQEELLDASSSVLLLSYTNRAVDEICSKLMEHDIDFIRIGGKFACQEEYRPWLLEEKVKECGNIRELESLILRTRVFVGTTASLNSRLSLFQLKQFSMVIIDEASQILEPHLIGLLSATAPDGNCAVRKLIMIGDHKQLPAVVQQREEDSLVEDPLLREILLTDCRQSLFERLLRKYRERPDVVYMLTHQGRMHHDIAVFPNQSFYQNRLCEVPLPHQTASLPSSVGCADSLENLLTTRRVAFVAVDSPREGSLDKVNSSEAQAIAATVVRIYEKNKERFSSQQTVGVIVPYRNQIAEVRRVLEKSGIEELRSITIDTVERFQGSQRDYILYGFTIRKRYQLSFLTDNVFEDAGDVIDRKLNVAMTRAREHLILFGNPTLLAKDEIFRKLLEFVKKQGALYKWSEA